MRNSIHRSGGQFQQRDSGNGGQGLKGRHSILFDAQVELTRVNKNQDLSRNEGVINLPY